MVVKLFICNICEVIKTKIMKSKKQIKNQFNAVDQIINNLMNIIENSNFDLHDKNEANNFLYRAKDYIYLAEQHLTK